MGLAACFLAAGGCLLCYKGSSKERRRLLDKSSTVVPMASVKPASTKVVEEVINPVNEIEKDNSNHGFVVLNLEDERSSDSNESRNVDSPFPESTTSSTPSSGHSASESGFSETQYSSHVDKNPHDPNNSEPSLSAICSAKFESPPVPRPSAKLYLCYSRVMSLLSIRLVNVSHLPVKGTGHQCYVSAKVLPDWKTSKTTKLVKVKGTEATIEESINFKPVLEKDLEQATIRIAAYLVENNVKTFVGEKYIRCDKVPLRSGKSYYMEEPLRSRRLVRRVSVQT